jgi:hypothetical protein
MVTRNRQRERENETHHSLHQVIHRYLLANPEVCQDIVYYPISTPVLEPVPEPPAPKRIKKPITDPSPKLTRAQKAPERGEIKLEIGWHWKDYYKDSLEWRTVSRNVGFLSNPLNYYRDCDWFRQHQEKEYEVENDPLEL